MQWTGCMRRNGALLILMLLAACGETPPPCTSPDKSGSASSAGCLVSDARGTLLVKSWSDEWALPGGSVAAGESARCGAEREVFEETGLAARAGELAIVFDNGFHLYWCTVTASEQPRIHRPLEVADVTWWNLEALPDGSWRYPGQGAMIRELIVARSEAPVD